MITIKNGMFVWVILLGALLLLATGCSSTFQTRDVTTSGFLSDYAQLNEGSGDEAQLLYINPQTDFAAYNKILMDPVKIYSSEDNKLEELSEEDRLRVLNYLDATIREQLKSDYTFVKEQGPGVIRLRIAITEAQGSQVVLDTMSSIIPIGMALGLIKKVATGTNLSVGEAGIEMELQDSQTGQRLAAAVDKRAGRKYTGKFDKYHTVEDAFDHWAERLQKKLAELRQK